MNRNRAFTLIELLVVIAIIAILAAILFPVFASAKEAAKRAVTVSNAKQINLAITMYAGDVDDTFPIRGTMNGNGRSWDSGACNVEAWGCPSWDKLIYPYVKTYKLLETSTDRTAPVPSNLGDVKRSFRVANNVVRGVGGYPTWGSGDPFPLNPLTLSSIPQPSNTILLTEQPNEAVIYGSWWLWSTFWENWVWGTGSMNTVANVDTTWVPASDKYKYYSGIDFGKSDQATFGFVDGSVKSRPRGFMFPGYEQRRGYDRSIDTKLKGVCLDYEDFSYTTHRECPIPQQ